MFKSQELPHGVQTVVAINPIGSDLSADVGRKRKLACEECIRQRCTGRVKMLGEKVEQIERAGALQGRAVRESLKKEWVVAGKTLGEQVTEIRLERRGVVSKANTSRPISDPSSGRPNRQASLPRLLDRAAEIRLIPRKVYFRFRLWCGGFHDARKTPNASDQATARGGRC